jgi:hypothetical protein
MRKLINQLTCFIRKSIGDVNVKRIFWIINADLNNAGTPLQRFQNPSFFRANGLFVALTARSATPRRQPEMTLKRFLPEPILH